MKPFEIIKFVDGDFELNIKASPENETVWLTKDDMASLFNRHRTVISRHIANIFLDSELKEDSVCAKFARTGPDGKQYLIDYYNLDVVVSVGYRVKSNRGSLLRDFVNDYFMSLCDTKCTNPKTFIFNKGAMSLSVKVSPEDDTVYLNETQIATLFETSRQNVNLHIQNIIKDGELLPISVRKDFLHTAPNGKKYSVAFYNLDMILAIGFRIKSQTAIDFRIWAYSVLRMVITKGYAVDDQTCLECKKSILELKARVFELEKTTKQDILFLPNSEDKSHKQIEELFKTATREILIVDNYFGHNFDDVLKDSGVEVTIITNINNRKIDSNDIYKVVKTNCEHDRFIIVDDSCYHFGMSIESLGEKFSLGHKITDEYVTKFLKDLKFLINSSE